VTSRIGKSGMIVGSRVALDLHYVASSSADCARTVARALRKVRKALRKVGQIKAEGQGRGISKTGASAPVRE